MLLEAQSIANLSFLSGIAIVSNHRYKSADKFIVFMHYVKILITLSCQCVMFCCVILGCLETCCYRCGDTLISYDDTHTLLYRGG